MSEQTANLCTTDACESLRARLAKYEDAEGRPSAVDERAAFEAHMRVGGYSNPDKHPDGSYVSSAMELWWQGWKARAALSAPSHGEQVREVATCSDCNDSHWRTVIDGDGIPRDEKCPCAAAAPSAVSQGGDV